MALAIRATYPVVLQGVEAPGYLSALCFFNPAATQQLGVFIDC